VLAVVVVVVLVAVGYSTNWFGLEKSSSLASCSTGVTLHGDGAQIAVPLMSVWTAAFQTKTGNPVSYPGGGSGTGLSEFTSTTVDFAMTDDPLTPAETGALPSPALTMPFVGGALTIIYNLPGLTGHLNLTGPVLAEIYQGNVSTWNDPAITDLNPGVTLPSSPITTVHRSDNAGTTYVLSDYLSQSSAYWSSHIGKGISVSFPKTPGGEVAEKGNSLVISTVVATKYSIGYSDLTDILTASSPPQYAAVKNPAGSYIVPTIANTESAISDKVASMPSIPSSSASWFNVSMVNANGTTDYPIATFLYMFVYHATDKGFTPSLAKSQVLVQWLDWAVTSGQPYADQTQPSQLYYAPLPASIVSTDQAGVSTMTFNGASIPACK
jgi:phosphate transport system substrate-binding protein